MALADEQFLTAGEDLGSNLRLDVGVQHAHNACDTRQSDVVPLEGFDRVLEWLHNPTHVRRVVQSWYVVVMPAPPWRSFAYSIYIMCVHRPPYSYSYATLSRHVSTV